jgi:hypothetical protein
VFPGNNPLVTEDPGFIPASASFGENERFAIYANVCVEHSTTFTGSQRFPRDEQFQLVKSTAPDGNVWMFKEGEGAPISNLRFVRPFGIASPSRIE